MGQGSAEGAAVCGDGVCRESVWLYGMHVVCSDTAPADLAAGLGLVSDQKILLILLLAVDKS